MQQGLESMRVRNNEIIVSAQSYVTHLPHSIEAFFVAPSSGPREREKVRSARDALLDEYELDETSGPPMVTMDLRGGSTRPFSLYVM